MLWVEKRHSSGVGVGLVVLAEEVFAVVVAVGGADHAVNVLARGQVGIFSESREVGGALVIEFDQDHGAVDAVVIDAG